MYIIVASPSLIRRMVQGLNRMHQLMTNVLKTGPITEPKRLRVQGLGTKSMVEPGSKKSSIDNLISWFGLVSKTLNKTNVS